VANYNESSIAIARWPWIIAGDGGIMQRTIFKNKPRLALVLSVIIIQQCCCCILPLGWQVQKDNPAIQQILKTAQARLAPLQSMVSWIESK
jgi:hypothetical protein